VDQRHGEDRASARKRSTVGSIPPAYEPRRVRPCRSDGAPRSRVSYARNPSIVIPPEITVMASPPGSSNGALRTGLLRFTNPPQPRFGSATTRSQRSGPATIEHSGGHVSDSWWVYDRPLSRDGLFLGSLLCGAAVAAVAITRVEEVSLWVGLYDVLGGAAAGFFLAGVVGGSVRNFIRGYREGSNP
jgi:hypothetical protein